MAYFKTSMNLVPETNDKPQSWKSYSRSRFEATSS